MKLQRPSHLPVLSASLKSLLESIAPQCPIATIITRALRHVHRYPSSHPSRWGYARAEHHTGGYQFALAIFNPAPIGNHFSFREKENMISYMPAGREQQTNADGRWERKGRVEMKPAKFLRALIHPRLAKRFKDNVFAAFSEKFRAHEASMKVTFEFVGFEDGYNSSNHKSGSPANEDSCMRNKDVGTFYESYGAKCLVAKAASGIYLGRAVVWKNVSGLTPSNDATFMDRVYAESPEVAELFFMHAASNGWYRKTRQATGYSLDFTRPDGEQIRSVRVTIDIVTNHRNVSFWPYLDTFSWMDPDTRELNNCGNDGDNELTSTHGEMEEEDTGTLCEDGNRYPDDECVEVDGSWYHRDSFDIVLCADCVYRMQDDCFYCSRNEEHYPNSEGFYVQISRNETITIHRDYVDKL